MLQNSDVLITGGAGFIGSHVVDELLHHDVNSIIVYDDLSRGREENLRDALKNHHVALKVRDVSRGLPKDGGILIHMAAKVANIEFNRNNQLRMFYQNMRLSDGVFGAIVDGIVNPDLLVYVSTACIYPHDAPVPTSEEWGDFCNPESTNYGYGLAKWFGEKEAQLIHRELGIPTIIVRFFNAVGTRDYYDDETSHVTPALIKRIVRCPKEEDITIWGSGQQTRALVDAEDIAAVLCKLIETPDGHDAKPINIGHQDEISIEFLAYMIMNATGIIREVSFDTSKPDGYPRRAACTKRLESLIGQHDFIPLHESLEKMVKDFDARYSVEERNA